MQPSRLTAEIPSEMLEVDVHHILAERVSQDRRLLVPHVIVGHIFRLSLRDRF